MEAQDKKLIWEDCPACAYKHLTAAYAAMTEASYAGLLRVVNERASVAKARAAIALGEYLNGYDGNLDLAVGCLAMAEVYGEPFVRQYRVALSAGSCGGQEIRDILYFLLKDCTPRAVAEAHVIEAFRELPALGGLGDADRSVEGALGWLREKILWVKETYELGGRDEAKA